MNGRYKERRPLYILLFLSVFSSAIQNYATFAVQMLDANDFEPYPERSFLTLRRRSFVSYWSFPLLIL